MITKYDIDVEIRFSKTYAEMNQLIKEHKVDVAYVCNSSYTKLDKDKTGTLLAIPILREVINTIHISSQKEKPFESLLDFNDKILLLLILKAIQAL